MSIRPHPPVGLLKVEAGTWKSPGRTPGGSADINGDGLEEAPIPAGNSLWAVNMDGDNKAEIAVVCRDGYLRIIDGP